MQASQSTVKSVHFSARGDTVFSMADDGKIKQYLVADTAYGVNAVPLVEIQAHEDAIRCGAVSSMNDHIVLTGGYDHKVGLWDIRSKEQVMQLNCEHPVESVLFLPGEQLIATAAGPIVRWV
uniref:WD_REPEATS_REGION domain-containing protein n=1 Tax=Caenorhabditis japonica TaxID=281687 RepID=A0A8R1EQZ1_CAEJA